MDQNNLPPKVPDQPQGQQVPPVQVTGLAQNVPVQPQQNPMPVANNSSNVIYSCQASFVNGVSAFSYHGGTLYLFNDHLVLSNNRGFVYFQSSYSAITDVNYKNSWRSKLIKIQTTNGLFQIAPFQVNNRNMVIGYGCGAIAISLAAYGGAVGAVFLLLLFIVVLVFTIIGYKKNSRRAKQLLSVLGQYVHVSIV